MKERIQRMCFSDYEKEYIDKKGLYNIIPLYTLGILEFLYEECFLGEKSYSECKEFLQMVDFNFPIEDIKILNQTHRFFKENNLRYPKNDIESVLQFYQSVGFFEVLADKVYFLKMSDIKEWQEI